MRRPCRKCGRPSATSICQRCKSVAESARPSRSARGYDSEYDRNAREIRAAVAASWARGETVACAICQLSIAPHAPLTVEHLRPLRDGGDSSRANLGPAHARCNYGWRRRS